MNTKISNKIISKTKISKEQQSEQQYEQQSESLIGFDNSQPIHGKVHDDIDELIKRSIIKQLINAKHLLAQKKYRFVKINLFTRPIYLIQNLERVVRIYNRPFKFNTKANTNDYTNEYTMTNMEEEDVIVLLAVYNSGNQLWFNIKTTGKEGWILITKDLIKSMKLF